MNSNNSINKMHSQSFYEENMLSESSIKNCGYEPATTSRLSDFLYQTKPTQRGACMRDSLSIALNHFRKLQNILIDAASASNWKFYNIVICSTPDKKSKMSVQNMLDQIHRLQPLWVGDFRTIFIPIEMGDVHLHQIMKYCEQGGEKWQLMPTDFRGFGQIFRKISEEMEFDKKRSMLMSEASEDNFQNAKNDIKIAKNSSIALSLAVQASGRMSGQKWEKIVNIISFFLRNLGKKDLVSGIIFNEQIRVVAKATRNENSKQKKFSKAGEDDSGLIKNVKQYNRCSEYTEQVLPIQYEPPQPIKYVPRPALITDQIIIPKYHPPPQNYTQYVPQPRAINHARRIKLKCFISSLILAIIVTVIIFVSSSSQSR